ncbi:MAG: putative rane protein [Clostridia bacterium]|nr:putative rane protein [Clostridia bacterium]
MTETKNDDIKSKWSNFWYYHKYHVIIIAFGVFVFFFLLFSFLFKEKVDLRIFYITEDPVVFTEKVVNVTNAIKKYTPDLDGDGEVVVRVENIFIGEKHDSSAVYENKKKLMTIMRAGDCMFLIADKIGMEYLLEGESLADISDIATDMYFGGMGWRVNDSEFMLQELNGFEDELYMGLRVYEGTFAQLWPESKENFKFSKEVLTNIIKNEKLTVN